MDSYLTFGQWLRERRKALDLTQAALAQRAQCAYGTIRRIEADELRPSRQLAAWLANALAIPTAQVDAFIAFARDLPNAEAFTFSPMAATQPTSSSPSPAPSPAALPHPLTSLIGRTHAVATVVKLLRQPEVRLLTLTGAPGVGKTRLALAVAEQISPHLAAGVLFVPLAAVRAATFVPHAIAQALGLPEGSRALTDQLVDALRARPILLLLDNLEHLVEAAPLLTDLLQHAPQLKLLATSRVVLRLSGEYEFPVPPLALPDPIAGDPPEQTLSGLGANPAVALFCARAQAAQPSFTLTAANASAISEICHRLDGLPLALELAAMRVKLLPPQILAQRLDQRLPLLTDGPRDAPFRQKTVEAAIAWSYDLLTAQQQALLARLAIFAGGWTLTAAEDLCGASDLLPILAALVDHSLIRREEESQPGEPRFSMLQVIREYALARLHERGEASAWARRHAQALQRLAQRAAAGLHGLKKTPVDFQPDWIVWLDRESDNLRAALAWSLTADGEAEIGLAIAAQLEWYWRASGRSGEGRYWLHLLLARTADCTPLRALGLTGAGILALFAGDFAEGAELLAQAQLCAQTVSDPTLAGYAQMNMGLLKVLQGEVAAGRALLDQVLTQLRAVGPDATWYMGATLIAHTIAAMTANDWESAEAYAQECLALSGKLAHPYGQAVAHHYLGDVLRVQQRPTEANHHYEESLRLLQQAEVRSDLPALLHNVAYSALAQGELGRAATLLQQSLTMQRGTGNHLGVAECLCGFAALAVMQGQAEVAARLFGAVAALEAPSDMPIWPAEAAARAPYWAATRARLGEGRYATAFAQGQALSLEQALAELTCVLSNKV